MKDSETGFTLVELLVSIALLGLTVGAVSSVFLGIQNVQRRTAYADYATRAAERQVEVLRSDNYGALNPGDTINFSDDLPSDLPPGSTGSVSISEPAADLRRVDVTVSYNTGGKQHNVTLSSLIGVIGITQ